MTDGGIQYWQTLGQQEQQVSEEKYNSMALWHQLHKPPASALKQIQAGRLKGKSDINPQWRYEAMTQVFGPCGIGWKFTIDRLWQEEASGGEVFAFALVSVYVRLAMQFLGNPNNETWSDPIPGQGGSMLVSQEKAGMHNSDEGYKMAITDALGTAMKMLGVAAEVYSGRWDGSKYLDKPEEKKGKITPAGGALDRLDDKRKATIIELAGCVIYDAKDELYGIQNAYNRIEGARLDTDEKVALWEELGPHSALRRALKEYDAAIKKEKK